MASTGPEPEPKSQKRPMNDIRPDLEDKDESPAPKRIKVNAVQHIPLTLEEINKVDIFWTRIFVGLVPEAYINDRFELPSLPPKSERFAGSLLCVSIDMASPPLVSIIKQKIQAEHGFNMKKQVLWTKDLEVLKDEQHCPEFIARTGSILYLTNLT